MEEGTQPAEESPSPEGLGEALKHKVRSEERPASEKLVEPDPGKHQEELTERLE